MCYSEKVKTSTVYLIVSTQKTPRTSRKGVELPPRTVYKGYNKGFAGDVLLNESSVMFFDKLDAHHYTRNLNIHYSKNITNKEGEYIYKDKKAWEVEEEPFQNLINVLKHLGVIGGKHANNKNEVVFLENVKEWHEIAGFNKNYIASYQKLNEIIESIQETKKREKTKCGYVYFMKIKGQNLVKIGVSKRPPKRKVQLETKMPFEIEIINKIKCVNPYEIEKEYHQKYKEKRVNGEWFEMTNKDINNILKINKIA